MSGRLAAFVVLLAYAASFPAPVRGAQAAGSHAKPQSKMQARAQASDQAQAGAQTSVKPEIQPITPVAAAPTPQQSGPTLAETVQWIEGHVTGLVHGSSRTMVTYRLKKGKEPKEVGRQNVSSHESVSVAKFDGCSLMLGQLTKGDDYTVVTVSTVPFDRLTRASWKVEKQESNRSEAKDETTETTIVPDSMVLLTLEGSASVISYRRRSTGSIPLEWIKQPFEGVQSSLVIHTDDQEMTPRLVNAFNHAIQLCHKDLKPEPF